MVEEETTQDQPEAEVPQDQDAPDPRLISRLVEADQRLVSEAKLGGEPSKDEETES